MLLDHINIAGLPVGDNVPRIFFLCNIISEFLDPIRTTIIPEMKENRELLTMEGAQLMDEKPNLLAGYRKPKDSI
jgi:hypothetical protein